MPWVCVCVPERCDDATSVHQTHNKFKGEKVEENNPPLYMDGLRWTHLAVRCVVVVCCYTNAAIAHFCVALHYPNCYPFDAVSCSLVRWSFIILFRFWEMEKLRCCIVFVIWWWLRFLFFIFFSLLRIIIIYHQNYYYFCVFVCAICIVNVCLAVVRILIFFLNKICNYTHKRT